MSDVLFVGLAAGLPFLLFVALIFCGPLTDRWGWTRTKGREREMMSTAFRGWNLAFNPEANAAVEYLKQCHDEEEGEGRKRRPHFPGISDGTITIRPLRDTADDVARLTGWLAAAEGSGARDPVAKQDLPADPAPAMVRDLSAVRDAYFVTLDEFEVPCVVERDGEAVGYLQFAHDRKQPGTYRVHHLLGPGGNTQAFRLLAAYLFELEGAKRVAGPTLETASPADCRFYLLH